MAAKLPVRMLASSTRARDERHRTKTTFAQEYHMEKLTAGIVALLIGLIAGAAQAQPAPGTYPNHPRQVHRPVCAGGPTDVMARIVAQKMSETSASSSIVENQAGAGGNIGMGNAAKAAPDGYTILFVSSSFVVNPSLYAKLPYDPDKDFSPVTIVGRRRRTC